MLDGLGFHGAGSPHTSRELCILTVEDRAQGSATQAPVMCPGAFASFLSANPVRLPWTCRVLRRSLDPRVQGALHLFFPRIQSASLGRVGFCGVGSTHASRGLSIFPVKVPALRLGIGVATPLSSRESCPCGGVFVGTPLGCLSGSFACGALLQATCFLVHQLNGILRTPSYILERLYSGKKLTRSSGMILEPASAPDNDVSEGRSEFSGDDDKNSKV
jgi:hypothetical protein